MVAYDQERVETNTAGGAYSEQLDGILELNVELLDVLGDIGVPSQESESSHSTTTFHEALNFAQHAYCREHQLSRRALHEDTMD